MLKHKRRIDAERRTHRVVKTLAPNDRGAIGWAREYGDALVCVRHRTDARGKVRHTTVELLVSSTPIRARATTIVRVRIGHHERALRSTVQAAGGRWDPAMSTWLLPRRVAGILNLRDRIVE